MKKSLATLTVALMLASTGTAFAASTVELTVKGWITPTACTPSLSGGGIVDHSKISAKDLNVDRSTRLPRQTLQLTVNCEAQALFALSATDNRPGSATAATGYGLGLIDKTQKIGNYHLLFANAVADNVAAFPIESTDGGASWMDLDPDTAWQRLSLAAFGDGSSGNNRRPIPIKDVTTDLFVDTEIAPTSGLNLTNEVQIDGSATIEVKYL